MRLMRRIALVMVEEFLVDPLAPAKALVNAVPVLDPRFAEFPAQVDLVAVVSSRKVDQAAIEVLDQTPDLLHLFDRTPQLCRGFIAPAARTQRAIAIDSHPTHH